ncbi:hypothetical protein SAMN03159496_03742 [Rhizobium sp. NFR07]|uniref:hypothetical protein n=1 Tax=Rhizobium sp. NFR07 TaxID=1566262 RepID=UPI0008E8BB5A|nr:hypothetical protein [Rhizobium sp. NFR07]SFB43853.1 hypothetical protein SAMN03159496_03742 [Rhizobium sp. NFR07]
MRRGNVLIALVLAVVGGLAVTFAVTPFGYFPQGKTDRLSGDETETAFLPARFGVPSSQQ